MASSIATTAGLTTRDVDMLCALCLSLKSKPEFDKQKFATLAGFANPESARTNLSKLLKKVMENDCTSPEATKKASGGKRKAATNDGAEDVDHEDTPTKKKGKKNKRSKKGDIDGDANERDGDTEVKDEV